MVKITLRYQTLVDAIIANGGVRLWKLTQAEMKSGPARTEILEGWRLNGKFVITQKMMHAEEGWDYYIQSDKFQYKDCAKELGLVVDN